MARTTLLHVVGREVVCGGHRVVVGGAYGEKLNEESREPGGVEELTDY